MPWIGFLSFQSEPVEVNILLAHQGQSKSQASDAPQTEEQSGASMFICKVKAPF